jgi:hypothetical protein
MAEIPGGFSYEKQEENPNFMIRTMKQIFIVISFLLFSQSMLSQKLSQVSLASSYISILIDQNVLIRITPDGKLIDWGTELVSQRNNFYDPKLQPYLGRVEYYGKESDSVFRGQVKSIGTAAITYYGRYDTETKMGKLKSIGTLMLDYYTNFDNVAVRGKLRFVGSTVLQYYSSLEDEAVRGRFKAVGSTPIMYYSSFDNRELRGKIKSIGTLTLEYYSSQDRVELRGQLKSNIYRPNIGGVTYIL